jgi:hypothetical protein
MCSIEGCDREPVAKGLCARHYMRRRRTGDPNRTRKAGRKRDPLRDLFQEWSRRTVGHHKAAMMVLLTLGGEELWAQAVKVATRPNGTLNVAELERQATFRRLVRQEWRHGK